MSRRDRETVEQGLSGVFGGTDLLVNVIRSDRTRGGRALEAPLSREPGKSDAQTAMPASALTTPVVTGPSDNRTDRHDDSTTGQPVIQQADSAAAPPRRDSNRKTRGHGTEGPDRKGILEARLGDARRMARSPTTTVTLRLPRELNDWLDEYVHRSWPQRVRKQELVAEAVRMLYARRGRQGEAVLDTELFEEAES